MKTATITQALRLCKSSLLSIDFVPILTHFCFDGDAVYAYNDISAVMVDLDTGLHAGIKGDTLLGVLSTLGEELEMVADGEAVRITSGKAKLKLAAMPASAFLFSPPAAEYTMHIRVTKPLLQGLLRVVETAGQNAMHREFTGVAFEAEAGKGVDVYSTDDTRLSHFKIDKSEVDAPEAGSWLVPASTVRQLCEIGGAVDLEDASLSFSSGWVLFSSPSVGLFSKLMPEAAPDYKAILKAVSPSADSWQPMPDGLVAALRRAEVLTAKEAQPRLLVETDAKGLKLEVEGDNALGSFTDFFALGRLKAAVALVVDPSKAREAAEGATSITFHPRCLGFQVGQYRCLVSPLETRE